MRYLFTRYQPQSSNCKILLAGAPAEWTAMRAKGILRFPLPACGGTKWYRYNSKLQVYLPEAQ